MKSYWDSSALVAAVADPLLQTRLIKDGGVTRSHSIAEVFSTLTGNPLVRISAEDASSALEKLAANLDFIDVGAKELLLALKQAGKLGVRGGRVHDYFHALAADKSGADELLTLDANDFVGLTVKAKIEVL